MEIRMMTQSQNRPLRPFKKTCRQALLICIAATAIGLLMNGIRPEGLDLIRTDNTADPIRASANSSGPVPIKLTAALENLKQGTAVFIDARSEDDFKAGHIKTALNLQEQNLDTWMPDFFAKTPPDTLLITYCGGPGCHLAERLAAALYEIGYTNVRPMTAGWEAWRANGHPAEYE